MHRLPLQIALLLAVALCACGGRGDGPLDSGDDEPDGPAVTFADARLRAAVFEALARPAAIDSAAVLALTSLDASGRGITSLAGIEALTGLRVLQLADNNIADIAPLAALARLQVLDLSGNRIADLTPLAGLTGLTHLGLDDNGVTDLTPLAGLTALVSVGLSRNGLTQVTALARLPVLEAVDLTGNGLVETAPWQLAALGDAGIRVAAEAPPAAPPPPPEPPPSLFADPRILDAVAREVRGARLGDEVTADILPEVESLSISCSWFLYMPWTARHHKVRECGPLSLEGIEQLTGLETLQVAGLPLADLSPLAGLDELRWLYLSYTEQIRDLSPLRGKRLERLYLNVNAVTDVSPLAGMESLVVLSLTHNGLVDLSPLTGLTRLSYLVVGNRSTGDERLDAVPKTPNRIRDLSVMAGMESLNRVYIEDNEVTDLSPLLQAEALISVNADGNPLDDAQDQVIEALSHRGVLVRR